MNLISDICADFFDFKFLNNMPMTNNLKTSIRLHDGYTCNYDETVNHNRNLIYKH